jgi:hypothetical protein
MEGNSLLGALVRINLFGIGLVIVAIFIAMSKKKLVKPMRKDISSATIKKMEIALRGIIILAIFLVFFNTSIPVAKDTIWVLKKGITFKGLPVKEGTVVNTTSFVGGMHFIRQSIYLEDNKSVPYKKYFMGTPVVTGRNYKIHYLPNSKSVIKVERR